MRRRLPIGDTADYQSELPDTDYPVLHDIGHYQPALHERETT